MSIDEEDLHLWTAPIVRDGDAKALHQLFDWVLAKEHGPTQEPATTFRTSLLATEPCRRYLVMRMVYPPERGEITARLAAIFDDGNERHARIQRWVGMLAKHGVITKWGKELSFGDVHDAPDPLRQSGHLDVVAIFQQAQLSRLGPTLLELKGEKSERFRLIERPKRPHFLQAQGYMHKAHQLGVKTRWGFIVYENKNDQARKEFKIAYDPRWGRKFEALLRVLNPIVDRLRKRPEAPRKGDLPPQEIAQWCGDCPQRIRCFALAKKGV